MLVLAHITPAVPAQVVLVLSYAAVCSLVVAHTRKHRELWANRIRQASYFSGLAAVGVVLFWAVEWLVPEQNWLAPVAVNIMHVGVMASFAAVAWHVGTNLAVTANSYYFTLLCKSCVILCVAGFAAALVIGIVSPFPMLGIQPVPESAFAYRWAILVPEFISALVVCIGFAGEYVLEPDSDPARKSRQRWFAAGGLIWLLLVAEHLSFAYLQTFNFGFLNSGSVYALFVGIDMALLTAMAVTWVRAITIDFAEKSRVQQNMDASLRQQLHQVSISRDYVDLCDLYSDWPSRAETLMLAVVVYGHKVGVVPQEKPAVAMLADIHLRRWREEVSHPPGMDELLEEQQNEIRMASGLFYEVEESEDILDGIMSGGVEVDTSYYPGHVQLALIAAAHHGLLPTTQADAVINGKRVEPYLVKIYRLAREEMAATGVY